MLSHCHSDSIRPFINNGYNGMEFAMFTCDDRIMPGSRVLVYAYWLFKDDKSTPARTLMVPGTVVCRYGTKSHSGQWEYEDLVDVKLDNPPEYKKDGISRGHFTDGVKFIG